MRILQVTNIVNPHQIPLARCIARAVGADQYRFVATQPPSSERQALGWNCREEEPWILHAGVFDADRKVFEQWWDEADIVICNERRFQRMHDRVFRGGKLTFYFSERWWKPPIGMARLLHPRFAIMATRFLKLSSSPLFHYLPIGSFAASDMRRIAAFPERMWQWGYFTALPNPLPLCKRNGSGLRVLWVGRMLAWKRVDTLMRAFSRLQGEYQDATLTLVGEGPVRKQLVQLAEKLLPAGSYRFIPPMPVSEILGLMGKHHIYVLPSNGYEGWGAVVNEAMSMGTAVVASAAAGSAKSMIRHQLNGLLFQPGDWRELSRLLCLLGKNEEIRLQIAREGQRNVVECWSPAVAAERFLILSEALLTERPVPLFCDGPMAPAY